MITVPLLVTDNEPFLEQCLKSLEGYTVLQLPSSGNMGEGRARGFLAAQTDYVAIVDPDDWVAEGAIDKCVEALEITGAVLAHTHEMRTDVVGTSLRVVRSPTDHRCHHLSVYRREAILPFVSELHKYGKYADWAAKAWLHKQGSFVCVDEVGYFYRQHPAQTSKNLQEPTYKIAFKKLLAELGYV